jgi:hypothetical protein
MIFDASFIAFCHVTLAHAPTFHRLRRANWTNIETRLPSLRAAASGRCKPERGNGAVFTQRPIVWSHGVTTDLYRCFFFSEATATTRTE